MRIRGDRLSRVVQSPQKVPASLLSGSHTWSPLQWSQQGREVSTRDLFQSHRMSQFQNLPGQISPEEEASSCLLD